MTWPRKSKVFSAQSSFLLLLNHLEVKAEVLTKAAIFPATRGRKLVWTNDNVYSAVKSTTCSRLDWPTCMRLCCVDWCFLFAGVFEKYAERLLWSYFLIWKEARAAMTIIFITVVFSFLWQGESSLLIALCFLVRLSSSKKKKSCVELKKELSPCSGVLSFFPQPQFDQLYDLDLFTSIELLTYWKTTG